MSDNQRRREIQDFSLSVSQQAKEIQEGNRSQFSISELEGHIEKYRSFFGPNFEEMKMPVSICPGDKQLHLLSVIPKYLFNISQDFEKGDLYQCELQCYMIISIINRHMSALCKPEED